MRRSLVANPLNYRTAITVRERDASVQFPLTIADDTRPAKLPQESSPRESAQFPLAIVRARRHQLVGMEANPSRCKRLRWPARRSCLELRSPKTLMIQRFQNDDSGYLRWREAYRSDGYVLN